MSEESLTTRIDVVSIVKMLREEYPELSLENIRQDVFSSIKKLGVSVKYSYMRDVPGGENILGYAISKDGRPAIVLSNNYPKRRLRFVLSQILGEIILLYHWLPGDKLDNKAILSLIYDKHIFLDQKEAEYYKIGRAFALEFLAPIEKVKAIVKETNRTTDEVIEKIALEFKLNKQIAAVRYGECLE